MIDRLKAEFHADDLYAGLLAFDLDTWSPGLRGGGLDAEERAKWDRKLRAATRRICQGLRVQIEHSDWQNAACAALRCRGSLPQEQRDNRMVWRSVLSAGALSDTLEMVVRFYLATWDGTGAVERGLGQDAAILQEHVGRRGQDGDLYSALVELKLEGPQSEDAMFKKGDGGVLLLTEFSRAAAQQWLRSYGRRFTCADRFRKDRGRKGPAPETRPTDKGVQLRARSAYRLLCKAAATDETAARDSTPGAEQARPTVLGIDRRRLMTHVGRSEAPSPAPKTVRFQNATKQKLAEKKAQGMWTGTARGRPEARLGGSLAIIARSRDAGISACRAGLWLRRRSLQAPKAKAKAKAEVKAEAKAQAKAKAKACASTPAAPTALVHDTLDELFRKRVVDPPSSEMIIWLRAVAKGGAVRTVGGDTMRFVTAVKIRQTICLSDDFVRKHVSLHTALRQVVAMDGSKWTLGSSDAARGGASMPVHKIDRKRDFIEFLLRARRLQFSGGA